MVSKEKDSHKIIDETRRSIVDALIAFGNLSGDKEYHDFLKWISPNCDGNLINDVWRHMDRFPDWAETYFMETIFGYLDIVWFFITVVTAIGFRDLQKWNLDSYGEGIINGTEKKESGVTFLVTFVLPLLVDGE